MQPLRIFVALYPPPDATATLLAALPADLPPHRRVPGEQVHMTLAFLGDTRPADVERVTESVERAAAGMGAFELAPTHLRALPERGPARLVAVETTAPSALVELQRRLAARLLTVKDRSRAFLAHLTLARFAQPTRCVVDSPIGGAAFRVGVVRLVQSRLRPGGAVHQAIREFPLT